jgi:hypothetical protein
LEEASVIAPTRLRKHLQHIVVLHTVLPVHTHDFVARLQTRLRLKEEKRRKQKEKNMRRSSLKRSWEIKPTERKEAI